MKSIDKKISELENQLQEIKSKKERIKSEKPTTIGGRIDRMMKLKGITVIEIANKVGYTTQTLYRYINDERKISAETLGEIAIILGVSCDYLILGKEETT